MMTSQTPIDPYIAHAGVTNTYAFYIGHDGVETAMNSYIAHEDVAPDIRIV